MMFYFVTVAKYAKDKAGERLWSDAELLRNNYEETVNVMESWLLQEWKHGIDGKYGTKFKTAYAEISYLHYIDKKMGKSEWRTVRANTPDEEIKLFKKIIQEGGEWYVPNEASLVFTARDLYTKKKDERNFYGRMTFKVEKRGYWDKIKSDDE